MNILLESAPSDRYTPFDGIEVPELGLKKMSSVKIEHWESQLDRFS
jgi:hypothetical protein